jgi:hypothetical protein
MMATYPPNVEINGPNMGSGNYADNFYQNVRCLRAKSVEGFNNACYLNFKIVVQWSEFLSTDQEVPALPDLLRSR